MKRVTLGRKQIAVLGAVVLRRGQLITASEIADKIDPSGMLNGAEAGVRVHVHRIRKALRVGGVPDLIGSREHVGYWLSRDVDLVVSDGQVSVRSLRCYQGVSE